MDDTGEELRAKAFAARCSGNQAAIEAANEAIRKYKHSRRVMVLDLDWHSEDEVYVTWAWEFGECGGVPTTTRVTLDWQPEERDVGINAGYICDGDCPEEVLEAVADEASERYDD
jgi:hypothetical protein